MTEPDTQTDAVDFDEDPNEVENVWAATIERRRREVREGRLKPIPAEVVVEELRAWKPKSKR